MRFFLYSHDGFGLGHTRRHVAIASALAKLNSQASILLASGADDVFRLGLPSNVDVLKLPALRKTGENQYSSRRLRLPSAEIWDLRSAVLAAAVEAFRPAVTLVDKHPFGAGGEFCAALRTIKRSGGRAVLGLRDILDDPEAVFREWAPHNLPESIAEYYDLVLVYGEQAIFDPAAVYGFPESVLERTRFCGYVINSGEADADTDIHSAVFSPRSHKRLVLATIGGGEDGSPLLETFLRASMGAPWQAVAIAGPMTAPNELEYLRRLSAKAGVQLHTFLPNLMDAFSSADALVCMGGYNTICEAVSKGIPTVCVPRTSPRMEQRLRAEAFERLGLVQALDSSQLHPETLREAIQGALTIKRKALLERANASLSFDGAQRAAHYLLALANGKNGAHGPRPLAYSFD